MHSEASHDRDRVARLRELAARLEALPPSQARDRLLREAHHRAVAVDTGVPAMSCWGGELEAGGIALFQEMALRASSLRRG